MRTPRFGLGRFGASLALATAAALACVSGSASGATSSPAGAGAPIDNRAPGVALNFAVSRFGVFGTGVSVRMFAFPLPEDWDACDGRALARSENEFLFLQLGTTYGGDGVTTFNLPDLRGRTPVGTGQGAGLQPVSVAQQFGNDSISLNAAHLPQHAHTKPFGGLTSPAGSPAPLPFDNRHASLGLRYSVALSGIFPTRPLLDAGETSHAEPSERGSLPGCPSLPYYGQLFLHAAAPTAGSFDVCDGKLLSTSLHGALFSLLGFQFGGSGNFHFALPDLLGRTPVSVVGAAFQVGVKRGSDFLALNESQLPPHAHDLGTFGPSLTSGGGQPFDNQQPTLDVNYSIVVDGVYPSVNFDDLFVYVGEVLTVAGTFAPQGTLPCDGRLLAVASYPTLSAVIGNRFGGDGVNTFALPDLRGRVPVGAYTGLALGTAVGEAMTTMTVPQMPEHTHQFTPPCPGDLNFDGTRDTADLVIFLGSFALFVDPGFLGDLNGDGAVNTQDLTIFLGRFGQVCPE